MTNRNEYLDYIKAGFLKEEGNYESEIASWKEQFTNDDPLLGYRAPRFPLNLAAVAAFLFEQTGDITLAYRAKTCLLQYKEFSRQYPAESARLRPEYAEGVPPLDAVFDPVIFAPACERIHSVATEEEYGLLAEIAADSLRLIWRFPEWGGHNRAMLRSASLAACARAFPGHPKTSAWEEMADELAEESWGRWSIEDAMMYQAHWLRSMILYAEARLKPELTDFIQPKMYLKAIVQMLSPLGILPDFGDSHWLMHSHWEWMALLEWGARVYGDPEMKWAAEKIWQRQKQNPPNLYAALVLTLTWRWCDDSISAREPRALLDALDDVVMKKLVFRTGWDTDAAYACVNYRDEGDYGRTARDYLRTNLAVSAEKMHHGHSDEGSFSMLVHRGTILLHESGYRESPPDGMYRADRYHNRVIWRQSECLPEEKAWDFFSDNGRYKPVRTERLYQSHLCGADIRRIRTIDEGNGLSWDRSIIFFPDLPGWVIFDTLLSMRTAPRTYGLLWWTNEILESSTFGYKTHVTRIQDWLNAKNSALWMVFPSVPGQSNQIAIEKARRSFQDESVIVNSWRGEHRLGRSINFVSVLMPRPYTKTGDAFDVRCEVMESQPFGRGLGVHLTSGGEEIFLTTLTDLTAGYLQADVRPRTSPLQGWLEAGPIGSDAAFVVIRKKGTRGRGGLLNGTCLRFAGKNLYQGQEQAMFQEDRSHKPGVPARFRWEGEI